METKIGYWKVAGIYKLTCIDNGKVYIGKAVDIGKRLSCHKNSKGRFYFERAVVKHGWDSFKIEILEIFENFDKLKDNDNLLKRESYFIELFDSTNNNKGYNICKSSTDRTGTIGESLSPETKEKMRQAKLGKKHSLETKKRMRQAKLGIPKSEEHKEHIRKANLGKTHSEESKDKMRRPKPRICN